MPQPLSCIEKGFSMSYNDLKDCKIILHLSPPSMKMGPAILTLFMP